MSVSFGCRCDIKNKDNWVIVCFIHNHSAFESPKYYPHYSDYSTVRCLNCGAIGRTKAKYVSLLELDKESVCNQQA